MENKEYKELSDMIKYSEKTVFFGGAGVSTESGIPDFRGDGGIYSETYGVLFPEMIVSGTFLKREPEAFFDFYKEKLVFPNAQPNKAHISLARLEAEGFISCVITQNIDGLHSAAGSKNVIELHGSALRNYCTVCGKNYGMDNVLKLSGVPRCECGGMVRPDVTLFDEALPKGAFERAARECSESTLLIVAGTSLSVYPAASLIGYAGGKTALINLTETAADGMADIVIYARVGDVMDFVCRDILGGL